MTNGIRQFSDIAGTIDMLDTKPNIQPDEVSHYMNRIGDEGRQALIPFYQFEDFIFPILYGIFFLLAISFYAKKCWPKSNAYIFLALLSIVMIVLDYIENFSIIHISKSFPNYPNVINYIGLITLCKWIVGIACCISTLIPMSLFFWKNHIRKSNMP